MEPGTIYHFIVTFIPDAVNFMSALFILAVGVAAAMFTYKWCYDRFWQHKDPVRRSIPFFGRHIKQLDYFGKIWRDHVGLDDRAQRPFNRADRETVYKMSHNRNNISAFGSTADHMQVGALIFSNDMFPPLEEDAQNTTPLVIGPYSEHPYEAGSLFNISAMSYGAISPTAIKALSKGAKQAGAWLNTGEGGLAPAHLEGGGDLVFQIGTAKYGVRDKDGNLDEDKLKEVAAHKQVKMVEIKLAQGAKPGKGGLLPAIKVTREIAKIRGIPEKVASVSPARHKEIVSVTELLDFVNKVRRLTGKPVGIKIVLGHSKQLKDLCKQIKKRGIESAPDFITIDGGDGGTGAAPKHLMDNVGLLLNEALPMASEILNKYELKERIRLVVSGRLITPGQVAWALCSGADFVNSARGNMFALGCVQAMRCNKNTCPAGIATMSKSRYKSLNPEDKGIKVGNYITSMQQQVEQIAHSVGAAEPRRLKPCHVRIRQADGFSTPMETLYKGLRYQSFNTGKTAAEKTGRIKK